MTTRYEYLELLATKVTDDLVICNVAGATVDWAHISPRDGNIYECWMSGCTPMALGLALALPSRRVISLDGDGSILMGLPVLPVVAAHNPRNLTIIVFDNQCYEPCKGVPTLTAGPANLVKIAEGSGITNIRSVKELREFEKAIDETYQTTGATFIQAKTTLPSPKISAPPINLIENKFRFVRYIEQTEKIQILEGSTKFGRT